MRHLRGGMPIAAAAVLLHDGVVLLGRTEKRCDFGFLFQGVSIVPTVHVQGF